MEKTFAKYKVTKAIPYKKTLEQKKKKKTKKTKKKDQAASSLTKHIFINLVVYTDLEIL